jgi:hypothetical protein
MSLIFLHPLVPPLSSSYAILLERDPASHEKEQGVEGKLDDQREGIK